MAGKENTVNVNWKSKIWKYATSFVVLLIIFNPEMVGLALFIDAIGLEMFLMLLEIQVLTVLGGFFSLKTKSIFAYIIHYIHYILPFSWKEVRDKPEGFFLFAVPSQATLMHMLVFSAVMGIAFNVPQ